MIKIDNIEDIMYLNTIEFIDLFDELSLYNKFKLIDNMLNYSDFFDILSEPDFNSYLECMNEYSFDGDIDYICKYYIVNNPKVRVNSTGDNILSKFLNSL